MWSRRRPGNPLPTRYLPAKPKASDLLLFPNTSDSVVGETHVKVVNACQIDGMLMAFSVELKENPKFLDSLDGNLAQFANGIMRSVGRNNLCSARARFLLNSEEKIAAFLDKDANVTIINLFGNDVDIISALFQPLMEMEYVNKCSNLNCDFELHWTSSAALSIVDVW